ncbi:short-chain dehydrogenase reductase 2 [Ilyonectria robusta]
MSLLLPASAVLATIAYGPPQYTDLVLQNPYLSPIIGRGGVKAVLGAALCLSLTKVANRALNAWALNNWRVAAYAGWNWDKEVAVVTGGCGGIGRELVLGLIHKRVKVAILDVIPLPDDMKDNPLILYVKTDITSAAAIAEAAATIRKTFGNPTILINNAGIAAPHTILETPAEFLPKIFGVNAIALWLLTKEFLPSMIKENKGQIVTTSSVTAYMALPRMVDYCASKAASLTFHEGLNTELKTKYKADGIITTIVQPSWVRTPMSPDNADEIELRDGKMLSPQEVAGRTLQQVFARRGGQLILPEKMSFFSAMKGWPNWMQELLRDAMGRSSLL